MEQMVGIVHFMNRIWKTDIKEQHYIMSKRHVRKFQVGLSVNFSACCHLSHFVGIISVEKRKTTVNIYATETQKCVFSCVLKLHIPMSAI
jgi:hypothetical protein